MSDWCYSMISGHWPTKRLCLIGVTVWYLCTGPQRDSVWLVLQNDTWALIHKTDQQRNVTVWYLHGHWLKQRLCLIGVTVWYLDTGPQRDCVWLVLQYDIWTLAHKETVSDWCYSMISGHWLTKRLCLICVTVWYLGIDSQRVNVWLDVTVWYLGTDSHKDCIWLVLQYDIWTLAHRDCIWLVLQCDIWTLAHKETVSDWCYSMISGHWPTKRLCLIGVTVRYLGIDSHRVGVWLDVTDWYLGTDPLVGTVWPLQRAECLRWHWWRRAPASTPHWPLHVPVLHDLSPILSCKNNVHIEGKYRIFGNIRRYFFSPAHG